MNPWGVLWVLGGCLGGHGVLSREEGSRGRGIWAMGGCQCGEKRVVSDQGVVAYSRLRLDDQFGALWPGLAAVHRRLGTPLGGQAPDRLVGVLVEAEEVADHATV